MGKGQWCEDWYSTQSAGLTVEASTPRTIHVVHLRHGRTYHRFNYQEVKHPAFMGCYASNGSFELGSGIYVIYIYI